MIGCQCAVCTSIDKKDNRLRSSILVQSATTTLVVDTGPDFRYQMLRAHVQSLDAVLITHAHKDHIAGMDDIRAFNFFQKKAMPVYASEKAQQAIKSEFHYAFGETFEGVPQVQLHTISNDAFAVGDISILPIPVMHLRMPVVGFRFGNFAYITDANYIPPSSIYLLQGTQVLVINALRQSTHISHFSLNEANMLADELKIPQVYFTHISHQMGLHQLINNELQPGRALAHDNWVLHVN